MWIDGEDIEIMLMNMVLEKKNLKDKDVIAIAISLICKFWVGCLTFDFS
jgi:hypothetical protein